MRGPGRPKGAKNKLTVQVKENIIAVFNRLGGTAEMANWATKNQTEFYKMYARLAPTQVDVNDERSDPVNLPDDVLAAIATGRSAGAVEPEAGETEPSGLH